MTQPAQNSGHEWPVIHEELVRACIHAALPDSLLPQLRDAELSIMATRIAARINAEIYKQVASVAQAAQPQEVPAEQRPLCPSCRASDNEPFSDANGVTMRACGRCMIQWRVAQPASAAKPADVSPRPLSAVEAMQNNDTQKKSPDYLFRIDMSAVEDRVQNWGSVIGFCDNGPCAHEKFPSCKNWIATHGYKIGEARRKEDGYATPITGMEMLTAFYPEQFPETPEQTESRRAREWKDMYKAMKGEQDQFLVKRAEREKEQSIRRSERRRIAAILEDETLKPAHRRRSRTQTIALIRSL